jgi:hypothetical protein
MCCNKALSDEGRSLPYALDIGLSVEKEAQDVHPNAASTLWGKSLDFERGLH